MNFKQKTILSVVAGALLATSNGIPAFAEKSAVEKQKELQSTLEEKNKELKGVQEQMDELDKQIAEVEEQLDFYNTRVSNLGVAMGEHNKKIEEKENEIYSYKNEMLLKDYYNMVNNLDNILFLHRNVLEESKPLELAPAIGVTAQLKEMNTQLRQLRKVETEILTKKNINEESADVVNDLLVQLSDKMVERIQLEKQLLNEKKLTEGEIKEIKNQLSNELRQKSMASFLEERGDTSDVTGDKIVSIAKRYLGVPYVWGGASPKGMDCSGLILLVMKEVGINPPRVSYEQAKFGKKVELSEIQPGDLLFFDTMRLGRVSHAGIYVGDGKILQAPQTGDVVKISKLSRYFESSFITARRYH